MKFPTTTRINAGEYLLEDGYLQDNTAFTVVMNSTDNKWELRQDGVLVVAFRTKQEVLDYCYTWAVNRANTLDSVLQDDLFSELEQGNESKQVTKEEILLKNANQRVQDLGSLVSRTIRQLIESSKNMGAKEYNDKVRCEVDELYDELSNLLGERLEARHPYDLPYEGTFCVMMYDDCLDIIEGENPDNRVRMTGEAEEQLRDFFKEHNLIK